MMIARKISRKTGTLFTVKITGLALIYYPNTDLESNDTQRCLEKCVI